MDNAIETELGRQDELSTDENNDGIVSRIARSYSLDSKRLLGLLQKLDFEESNFVTCDAWKRDCGGVPRGSFILFRIDPRAVDPEDQEYCNRLTLARVTNSAPTPVESNVQQTLFQAHKLQAQLDPLTHQELQWSALKANIVGTYYDDFDEEGNNIIGFGNDVDSFFSPYAYVAYLPTDEHLELLINSFVKCKNPVEIGNLRYTETPSPKTNSKVPILIDPKDVVGESNAAQRLANFGKTRFGKSNTTKIVAQSIFQSKLNVAQVFFDPSGEYTYINDQDGTSLYSLNHKKSVRYSLLPKALREDEKELGLEQARSLSIDYYTYPSVGHSLIAALWNTENNTLPGYMRPVLDWSPEDTFPEYDATNPSPFNHFWRTTGLWYALLYRADFEARDNLTASINFSAKVKEYLVDKIPAVEKNADGKFHIFGQPISVLPSIYRELASLYRQHRDKQVWFPSSRDGSPYFNDIEEKMLLMFDTSRAYTAHNYLRPFNKYHNPQGSSIFEEISNYISAGLSVFIDMAQSNEVVRNNLVEQVCKSVFSLQNKKFNSIEGVGDNFVMFYFEEAHRLFRKDDTDLNSIYNLLAKEGAKLNIGMNYSTQSMTTISPDLLKNTDNFFIAHLDDDRETREVARKYAFRDVAEDVQRVQSKGFVRMITRSHRFALPVQIHKFAAPQNSPSLNKHGL